MGSGSRPARCPGMTESTGMTIAAATSPPRSPPRWGCRAEEFARAEGILGRTPNLTELGVFSAMWSEHCSYKSSKVWLKTLPTDGPRVICGPGENAGVVDIGDGDAVVFKIESHNHPSFIEPYQGAATGVGGILRDVFTMGARPIAMLNSLRFGSPDHPKTRHLVVGRRRRDRRLRQLRRRADGRRRVPVPPGLQRQHPGQRDVRRARARRPHLLFGRGGRREPGDLCRRQDRARRHPRRDDGLGRVRRGRRRKAPDRAGRRPVHREIADRGLPRTDGRATRSSRSRTWARPA